MNMRVEAIFRRHMQTDQIHNNTLVIDFHFLVIE